jgi:hypothetical protein
MFRPFRAWFSRLRKPRAALRGRCRFRFALGWHVGAPSGRSRGGLLGARIHIAVQSANAVTTSVLFCPPNPKELQKQAETSVLRFLFGM